MTPTNFEEICRERKELCLREFNSIWQEQRAMRDRFNKKIDAMNAKLIGGLVALVLNLVGIIILIAIQLINAGVHTLVN